MCLNGAMVDVRNQPGCGALGTPGDQPHGLNAKDPEAEMQCLHHENELLAKISEQLEDGSD